MDVSVVVPVYNASGTLTNLVSALSAVLPACARRFEIILVNDNSKDDSWPIIERLSREHHFVRGINLMRNYGQHNALLCGIRAASFDVTVTLDDDLQNPPSEIPKLLSKLSEGYDVVYGAPVRQQHGLYRDLASAITKWVLAKAIGNSNAQSISAFRAFRTELRNAFVTYQNPFVCIDVLLTYGTTNFGCVMVEHDPRRVGSSQYSLLRLITHAFNMITGFTTVPLQLASLNGFVCMLIGVAALIYVLARYIIQGGSVPGFPFLASLIVILCGGQLLALGIVGEYLARMHARTTDRPTYSVRNFVGAGAAHDTIKQSEMDFAPDYERHQNTVQQA